MEIGQLNLPSLKSKILNWFSKKSRIKQIIYTFEKKEIMSYIHFEKSTAALGTIVTIILIAIVASIIAFG